MLRIDFLVWKALFKATEFSNLFSHTGTLDFIVYSLACFSATHAIIAICSPLYWLKHL